MSKTTNDDNVVFHFDKFMKKILETEEQKTKVYVPKAPLNPIHQTAETPQREYVRRYDERAVNRIVIGRK